MIGIKCMEHKVEKTLALMVFEILFLRRNLKTRAIRLEA